MPDSLEQVLSEIDRWPAPAPRVAVIGSGGVIALRGHADVVDRWASVSKLLVAYAVLMAEQDHELSLDDPAGPPGATIRHLLAHTSGLPFEGKAPIAAPGVRRIYSNTGFDVLGQVIADATGYVFEEYLTLQVLEPLSVTVDFVGAPSAGLSGTLKGLARFARELLSPTLLDIQKLQTATSVVFPGLAGVIPGLGRFQNCDWGLGFEIRDQKVPHWTGTANSPETFGHFGGSGSFLWVDPVRGLAMCGLSGRTFDDDDWAVKHWPPLFDAVLSEAH